MLQNNSALTNIVSTSPIFLINLILSVIFIVILTGIVFLVCSPLCVLIRAISFLLNSVKGDSFREYLSWTSYISYIFIVSEIIIVLYLCAHLLILYLTSKSFLLV